ncbi:unnamed protein product [Prorocentrum cordatum]|uniref:Uncharacterized protein n=1 Tax=Prorocentrum cordatum TaxID=2364126 RepID=A0ABN9SYE2_9DINO|nr:unnamed protein product [Polarella glacialis]
MTVDAHVAARKSDERVHMWGSLVQMSVQQLRKIQKACLQIAIAGHLFVGKYKNRELVQRWTSCMHPRLTWDGGGLKSSWESGGNGTATHTKCKQCGMRLLYEARSAGLNPKSAPANIKKSMIYKAESKVKNEIDMDSSPGACVIYGGPLEAQVRPPRPEPRLTEGMLRQMVADAVQPMAGALQQQQETMNRMIAQAVQPLGQAVQQQHQAIYQLAATVHMMQPPAASVPVPVEAENPVGWEQIGEEDPEVIPRPEQI